MTTLTVILSEPNGILGTAVMLRLNKMAKNGSMQKIPRSCNI